MNVNILDRKPVEAGIHQIEALEELLADCVGGWGRVAVVTGAVGSGKTHVLQEFADRAAATGAAVLTAVASRAEQGLPLGVVDQLLHSADLPPATAARVSELLRAGALELDAPVLHGLCRSLLELAERVPVVITVDDFHHADLASQQCLGYVARRLRRARMVMALAESTRMLPGYPAFQADPKNDPRSRVIRVKPLTRGEVSAIVDTSPELTGMAGELHAISGGNPKLLNALIEDARLGDACEPPGRLPVGDAYAEAVLACLYRGEPIPLQVARALAILGGSAPPGVLARLLSLDTDVVRRALHLLDRGGIVDGDRLRHRAAEIAVLSSMTAEERSAMHGRAAALLHSAGEPAPVVAGHLVRTDDRDESWALSTIEEAVEQALDDGASDRSLALLQPVLATETDPRQRAQLLLLVTRTKWRTNPASAVQHLPELADAVRAGHLTGTKAVATATYLMWHGQFDEAAEVLDALTLADQVDVESSHRLLVSMMWLCATIPAQADRVRRAWSTLVGEPGEGADPAPGEADQNLTALLPGGPPGLAAAEELLERVRLNDEMLGPIAVALYSLILADRPTVATAYCEPLLREAKARRAPTWEAVLSVARAEIALHQGDLACALEHGERALRILPPKSWGVTAGGPLSTVVQAATAMGDYERAERHLATPLPAGMFRMHCGTKYLFARGTYFLATGRLRAAAADLQNCGDTMVAWGLDLPDFLPWRTALAQAKRGLGDQQEARRLAQEQLSLITDGQARARGMTLRALAAASEPARRLSLLREAVDLLQTTGDRLETAWAYGDLSDALHEAGDSTQARRTQRTAWYLAKQCQAQPLLRRLQPDVGAPEQARDPAPADGPLGVNELSEAELRVAALAALGHTNREIARRLYVTVSTVEQHLTRVYRKLRVTRRADLPAGLSPTMSVAQDGGAIRA